MHSPIDTNALVVSAILLLTVAGLLAIPIHNNLSDAKFTTICTLIGLCVAGLVHVAKRLAGDDNDQANY